MRPFLAAVALAAAVLQYAPTASGCETPERVIEALIARFPDTSLRARLTGAQAADFVLRYNRIPPVTAHHADEVLVFEDQNFPRFNLVELFRDSCLVAGGVLAVPFVDNLLSSIDADI